ncbi:MAG: hypothetical protein M1607_02575 [Patescibacteria group bacterium]|nr:hypothetical protein [Patescibacteria group bacterium]
MTEAGEWYGPNVEYLYRNKSVTSGWNRERWLNVAKVSLGLFATFGCMGVVAASIAQKDALGIILGMSGAIVSWQLLVAPVLNSPSQKK